MYACVRTHTLTPATASQQGSKGACAILYQCVSTYGLFEFDISAV